MALTDETREQFQKNNPLKRFLVNSVPKSGTTWVRTMICALPGYERYDMTGDDGNLLESLPKVEPGQVFHGHFVSSRKLFEILEQREFATVYVYRDLRDIVVSNYFHCLILNPKRATEFFNTHQKEQILYAENLHKWSPSTKRYPDVRRWLKRNDIPTVTYEALTKDTVGEMKRILTTLGFWTNDELIRYIVAEASFEKLSGRKTGEEDPKSPQRKGIVGDWKNHFSERNKEACKESTPGGGGFGLAPKRGEIALPPEEAR